MTKLTEEQQKVQDEFSKRIEKYVSTLYSFIKEEFKDFGVGYFDYEYDIDLYAVFSQYEEEIKKNKDLLNEISIIFAFNKLHDFSTQGNIKHFFFKDCLRGMYIDLSCKYYPGRGYDEKILTDKSEEFLYEQIKNGFEFYKREKLDEVKKIVLDRYNIFIDGVNEDV